MLKLKVIVASTRPGRVGLPVGEWFVEFAQTHAAFDVELVDLAEVNLPLFDEPEHPILGVYEHAHTKSWSQIIDSADAYVFVLPEYNYFAPATLINALDYLHHEWYYKPVGIVSYGGISAGTRSAQSVKPLLSSLKLVPIPEGVFLPFVKTLIDEDTHAFLANDSHEAQATKMLDEIAKWGNTLLPLHQ